jgi:hypothetical protein
MSEGAGGQTVFLIGDRFSGFATQNQISTIGSFIDTLRAGSCDDLPDSAQPA